MKKKSQRINDIVELKGIEESKALQIFAESQKNHQQKQNQLQGLVQYRLDYLKKYQALADGGVNIKQLLEYRSFMDKLDKAIKEQEQIVKQANSELQVCRQGWEKIHFNIKGLQKVSDLALAQEQKQQDKQEQNEQDDRVSCVGRNSTNGMGNA